MKKLITMAAMLFILAGTVFANGLESKNAIGMYILGSSEAVGGIQYERRFSDLVSTKFGVYAMYNDKDDWSPFDCNFTVETDFTLYDTTWNDKISSRLFAYALAGYKGGIEYYRENYEEETPKIKRSYNNAVASLGFGFDFIFFDHLSVPVQFGFLGTFPDTPNVAFCGGIALRYTW